MNLSNLRPPKGQKQKKQRIGQGMGTGRGKYSGRGAKGAKSISGYSKMRGFEGGQMPLHRRLPKRGFTNIFRKEYAIVNLALLDKLEGDTFTPDSLQTSGVVRKLQDGLKILGGGELTRKITVRAHLFSKAALDKIQKAGGVAETIEKPVRAEARANKASKGEGPKAAVKKRPSEKQESQS
jgi:large subunit ribosomal protein L15